MPCSRVTLRVTAVLFSRCARRESTAGHLVRHGVRSASKSNSSPFPKRPSRLAFARASGAIHVARVNDPQIDLVRRVCHIIDEHDEEQITLERLSSITGVNAQHLQRTFKELMGITPRQYAESRKLAKFKAGVKQGSSVTEAMYDAGYGSSRALYEKSSSQLGMTPATYGKGGKGM